MNENSVGVVIAGYDGTFSCTNSCYYGNDEYLYEMTNDDDDEVIVVVWGDGEIYAKCPIAEIDM